MVAGNHDFGPLLFQTGDLGRLSVTSDSNFKRCAVNSDGDSRRYASNFECHCNLLGKSQ